MDLQVRLEYLQELIDDESKSLVGKICKRFEIIPDRELLKKDIKELIYEEFRNFKGLLMAGGVGLERTKIIFKSKEKIES